MKTQEEILWDELIQLIPTATITYFPNQGFLVFASPTCIVVDQLSSPKESAIKLALSEMDRVKDYRALNSETVQRLIRCGIAGEIVRDLDSRIFTGISWPHWNDWELVIDLYRDLYFRNMSKSKYQELQGQK